jgi:ABC-2 type transport system ATP-binding protein
MSAVITGQAISKRYGKSTALNNVSLSINPGRIVGLIGPNGSGKTTLLKAILGLLSFEGQLSVLGLDPRKQRDSLMNEICFISDVAILPSWITAGQAIDFVEGVHSRFDRKKAERYLAATKINAKTKVKTMSKGMVVQLHLALIMAIDAKILVLDEPTLGLDILYRKQFYQQLLEDYFDAQKTIIVTTHQVEEVEHILTDLIFIRDGQITLTATLDELQNRFTEVLVPAANVDAARLLNPIDERQVFGKSLFIFDSIAKEQLQTLGEMRAPSIADLFVANMKGTYS